MSLSMSMNDRYDARRVPARPKAAGVAYVARTAGAHVRVRLRAAWPPLRHVVSGTQCHRRGWLLERCGWVAMAVVVAGAAAGVFGRGWLSETQAAHGDALTVTYSRLSRAHMPDETRPNA
jgi:hypothetical protein